MRVLVFGDSITQGFWDSEGGWVNRLRKYYDEEQIKDLAHKDEPTIFNLGISGDVTEGVLNRFENEVKARKWRWPDEEFTFIFAIGINDTAMFLNQEPNVDNYGTQLKELILKAKQYSKRIIFVELTPVEEDVANKRPGTNKIRTNDRIKRFNIQLKSCCNTSGVHFLPIFEEFKERLDIGEDLLADGLHPNNTGHQLIYELVKPELEKFLK